MNSNFKIFLKGIVDVSPLMIPVVPFGLIFGVLAIDIGFTPLETMGMSLIVFGGASQIVLLQLFSGGASSLVIISSVGAVNSRHLLYGAVVSEHLSDLKLIWKIIISYFLIDQAFAISNEYLKKNKERNRYFHLVGGGATCWVIWQSTTLLGIILGASIPEKLGLSFAVPLTFLALLVNDFRKLINVIVIIISGTVATLGYNYIPFKAYVIVAALAGLLTANFEDFVSPDMLFWTFSGELIFMVVLGGMGTVMGPLGGAMIFLFLSEILSNITAAWHLIIGPFLILVVLFARGGVEGFLKKYEGPK